MRHAWLILALALGCPADSFDSLRAHIKAQLAETKTPSLAVALARDGQIVWEEGFGWANQEKRVAATGDTMYSLASISKPITATGLMILVERGLVDLDKPVNDYLGQAKIRARVGDAREATVRRVASHSSGLPLHYQFFYVDEPYRRPPMDETIRRYGQLVFPPGERYQYSNLGYGILDYVIARAAGKPYKDFMREEVFAPLGLTHTSVDIAPGLEPYAAARYAPDTSPIPFYDFDHPGGSAIWSSAHDLVRFGMFHLKQHAADQKQILRDASIDAMQKGVINTGPHATYGLGWAIADGNFRIVSHTGGMGGVATALRLVPSEKLALVVLCNSNTSLPHQIADRILVNLLPGWKPRPDPAPQSTAFRAPAELIGIWKGVLATYQRDLPLALEIAENAIYAQLDGGTRTALSGSAFRDGLLTARLNGDIGTEDANRRPYQLQLTLKLRGGALNGPGSAISLPGKRAGNALTSWVELQATRVDGGAALYNRSCTICHGPQGTAGERAPALVGGRRGLRRTGEELFGAIKNGIPGTLMPASPLADNDIREIIGYLRDLGATAADRPSQGDPARGEAIFQGKGQCANCHMIGGRGGILGPDLSRIASERKLDQLREALTKPREHIPRGYQPVTLTLQDGRGIRGIIKNEHNTSLQVLTEDGSLQLIARAQARKVDYPDKSLMPADYDRRLSSDEFQDLLAYLSRLSGRRR